MNEPAQRLDGVGYDWPSEDDLAEVARPTLGMGGGMNRLGERSVEWYTPPHIFDALGLQFVLDPCAPPGGVPWIPAARHYSAADDGFSQPWEGRVWLNPPYGRDSAKWVGRLIEHGHGIALVFARTDPSWGQYAIRKADAVCFIAGRLRFIAGLDRNGPGHNAPASSMLLAYGPSNAEALDRCGLGVVLHQRPPSSTPCHERNKESGQ